MLLEMITNIGQMQFFVYELIIITAFVVLKNNITLSRIKSMTFYMLAIYIIIEFSRMYRYEVILDMPYEITEYTILITFSLFTAMISFWLAYFIESNALKHDGWLYVTLANGIHTTYKYLEVKLLPWIQSYLTKLENNLRSRAKHKHPVVTSIEKVVNLSDKGN